MPLKMLWYHSDTWEQESCSDPSPRSALLPILCLRSFEWYGSQYGLNQWQSNWFRWHGTLCFSPDVDDTTEEDEGGGPTYPVPEMRPSNLLFFFWLGGNDDNDTASTPKLQKPWEDVILSLMLIVANNFHRVSIPPLFPATFADDDDNNDNNDNNKCFSFQMILTVLAFNYFVVRASPALQTLNHCIIDNCIVDQCSQL